MSELITQLKQELVSWELLKRKGNLYMRALKKFRAIVALAVTLSGSTRARRRASAGADAGAAEANDATGQPAHRPRRRPPHSHPLHNRRRSRKPFLKVRRSRTSTSTSSPGLK